MNCTATPEKANKSVFYHWRPVRARLVRQIDERKIDPPTRENYSDWMSDQSPKQQFEQEFKKLETRLNELLRACGQLKEENRSLRQRQDALINERAGLLQKNEQVRSRVESMISRLKAMESGS